MEEMNRKITIIVNTCDIYDDLWYPFFTLLKRYWNPEGIRILLNTETKNYSFEGLDIECIHQPPKCRGYGHRILNVLKQVKTPYVIPLMDDFFFRKPVDTAMLEKIIQWMDADESIVYFNQDATKTYMDWEVDRFPEYRRIPNGTNFTLNMQAAVWRTEKLIRYWRPNVNPWEWECFSNCLAYNDTTSKFYCIKDYSLGFCDYGLRKMHNGVAMGGWVKDDVVPFFEKEGIAVDYSRRGFYIPGEGRTNCNMQSEDPKDDNRDFFIRRWLRKYKPLKRFLLCLMNIYDNCKLFFRCWGLRNTVAYLCCVLEGKLGPNPDSLGQYLAFLQEKARAQQKTFN